MIARIGLGALLASALVLAAPLAASAHVHIDPEQSTPGTAEVGVTFTVPNEEATARTTAVRIALPASAGFTTADPVAIAGWRATVRTSAGKPAAIEYHATGGGIGDGQTQAFIVTLGAVPNTGSVLLAVTQTYSNGQVVRWNEATPASGAEPEHPAPTLYITDTAPADHDTDDDAAEAEQAGSTERPSTDDHSASTAAPAATSAADGSDTLALGLATAALVIALGALAAAVVALLRRRR